MVVRAGVQTGVRTSATEETTKEAGRGREGLDGAQRIRIEYERRSGGEIPLLLGNRPQLRTVPLPLFSTVAPSSMGSGSGSA